MDASRPLLIFDGDCSFCRRWIARWNNLTGEAIDYEPSQTAAERFPQIPREEFGKSVFLVEPDGKISRGAEAVFRTLSLVKQKHYVPWLYEHVPPFAWLCELLYRLIAARRDVIDPIDRIIIGTQTRPITYRLTRAIFLRLLGLVYFIAFVSLFTQIDGLVGSNGILPATPFVEAVTKAIGSSRWWRAPTLAYFNSSDAGLHALCITGIVCSIVLMIGALPLLMTIILWATYLSLAVVCQTFLGFQWDALLLEAGFLAILWSPPLWAGTRRTRPSGVVLFLIRWLLFRLMFLSALTKWIWQDTCWRDLTALRYHFETQPLPTWTSWYAHHSPDWMLRVSCAIMFFIEFVVPFFYFLPRRTRLLGFWLTFLLQINIMITGNYGFFNVLTIVLAVSLLDDPALAWVFRWCDVTKLAPHCRPILRPIAVWPLSIVVFVVTTMALAETWRRNKPVPWPKPLATLQQYVQPFQSTNSYGLFRVMTRERPEIIIEGSDDQRTWKEYVFKYKMGDVNRRPAFCEPHMPRLDWQMWFAALDPPHNWHWLQSLLVTLLNGQPEVLDLMGENPFPDHPPKYIRAVMYDYEFSKSGPAWWTRTPKAILVAPTSLRRPGVESFRL